jgi:murein hydrolase activator
LKVRLAALLCAIALAAAFQGVAAAAEKDELRALRQRLEKLRSSVASKEDAHAQAADALRASETAISSANRALRERVAEQENLERELQSLEGENAALRASLDTRRAELARLFHARYVTPDDTVLKQVLSGEKPGEGARRLNYQRHLLQAQAALIQTLQTDLKHSETLRSAMRDKHATLNGVRERQEDERRRLLIQTDEKRRVLARLADQIKVQRRELQTAQRNEARLAKIVEELAKALKAKPKVRRPAPKQGPRIERVPEPEAGDSLFAQLKGRLRLPVRGELAERFGTPRQEGGLPSKGVFIRAREGEEVRAVAKGQVVFSDWLRGFGNLLILNHGGDYMTVYGNNESVLKQPGDEVEAGDAIATVGASGGNEKPGLYFEMRYQGRPFDPLSWVSLK